MSIPVRRKIAYSAITTVAFAALLEAALWFVGFQPVTETDDPFVGFASNIPLFVSSPEDSNTLVTAENKLSWFNWQTFPRRKPAGTYRIFSLGGSTTFGRPFRDATSYTGWLREYLKETDPSKKWELINAGGVSYASYRVASVMEELTAYDPDLFIVYSAQNEFLESRTYESIRNRPAWLQRTAATLSKTRTWAALDRVTRRFRTPAPQPNRYLLPGEVDEILNHTIGPTSYQRDDAWRERVLDHYRLNLERMIEIADSCGAEILFITPASNLKDCAPFKSSPAEGIGDSQLSKYQTLTEQALELEKAGRTQEALALWRDAIAIDPRNAGAHFEAGRLYFASGQMDAARREFLQALEQDVCPLRAVRRIPEEIREAAHQHDAMLVDFEKRISDENTKRFGHANLGAEFFLDHVHPNVEGHRLLAEWIYATLQQNGVLSASARLTPEVTEIVTTRIENGIDTMEHGVALRNLAKVMHWAGKFREAGPLAMQALTVLEDDLESLSILADCYRETGQYDKAIIFYRRALEQDLFHFRSQVRLGELLSRRGDWNRAKEHLTMAAWLNPDDILVHRDLGIAHLRLGEHQRAIEALTTAVERLPEDAKPAYFLARAYSQSGSLQEAERWFRRAIELNPQDPQSYNQLGLALAELDRKQEAIQCFDQALSLRADFEEAIINRQSVVEDSDASP